MIKVSGLSKVYGMGNMDVWALKNIFLSVKKGGFIAIMGPSGSGKTTLINILGCLDTQSSGEYILNGVAPLTLNGEKKAKLRNTAIGFVFQSFFLLSKLNAYQNIELPLIYRGVSPSKRRKIVTEMLDIMGLADRATHLPSELSGGQMQRVAIGRALINDPYLILADEPTGNLDTRTGREIMRVLALLNERGTTVVLITHEKKIAAYANRVYYLKDGVLSDYINH